MSTKPFLIMAIIHTTIQQYNWVSVEVHAKRHSQQKENEAAGDIIRIFFTFFGLFFLTELRVSWVLVGSLKMNTTLEYSTRVVQEGDRRCKKSTLNDLAYLTPLRTLYDSGMEEDLSTTTTFADFLHSYTHTVCHAAYVQCTMYMHMVPHDILLPFNFCGHLELEARYSRSRDRFRPWGLFSEQQQWGKTRAPLYK